MNIFRPSGGIDIDEGATKSQLKIIKLVIGFKNPEPIRFHISFPDDLACMGPHKTEVE